MFTLIQTLRIREQRDGLALLTLGMSLAISASRRDLECDLAEVQDDAGQRWYDKDAGMFLGDSESDQDFRAMTMQSLTFLDKLGRLEYHPDRRHWVRYIEQV